MTATGGARRQRRVNLLWDENLSPAIAQALRILGYPVTWVKADGQPGQGTLDEDIVEHTMRTGQTIVTSNHDMMQICAEAGQRFVWLDPRGRQLTKAMQVRTILGQIDRWIALLDADDHACVHAMRTRCRSIDAHEASRLATQRMKVNERKRRQRRSRPVGPMMEDL